MKKYDLTIAYRIYPKISKVPAIHSEDKYKLSKICLQSFYNAMGNVKPYIFIILDGCPPEYKKLFEEVLIDIDYEFVEKDGIGNGQTFNLQMDLLLNQDKSELIYFAEDDYFYLEGAFRTMVDAMDNPDINYLSPYDHPDVHTMEFHNYKKEYITIKDRKWLISSSTTLTFMTRKQILRRNKHVFDTYARRNYDASMWISMTKLNTFNLKLFFKFMFTSKPFFKIYLKVIYFNFFTALFEKKRILVQASPSLATHIEKDFLAHNIDWYKEFQKYDA